MSQKFDVVVIGAGPGGYVAAIRAALNYYDVPLVSSTLEAIYDFKGGRYFVDGLDNNEPMYDFGVQVGPRDFTPQALRREGN